MEGYRGSFIGIVYGRARSWLGGAELLFTRLVLRGFLVMVFRFDVDAMADGGGMFDNSLGWCWCQAMYPKAAVSSS